MNVELKVNVLAKLQRDHEDVFWKLKRAYGEQYGSNASAYFSSKLHEWAEGKIQAREDTLKRIDDLRFPSLALCEKETIIEMLYLAREINARCFIFVIDKNIEERKKEVLSFLGHFKADDFRGDLSCDFEDCATWVCGGDSEAANLILRRLSEADGKRMYSSLAHDVNRFLRLLPNSGAEPQEVSFSCEGATIEIKVRHKYFKRVRDVTNSTLEKGASVLKTLAGLIPKRKER